MLKQSQRVREKRLMKELRDIQNSPTRKAGMYSVELCGDNLYEWDVKLFKFDEDSELAHDLEHMKSVHGIDNVWLRFSFPDDFPFSPPFVRVIAPLVQGGYVLSGGAICLELLTPQGWSQAYKMESVIMQISSTMVSGRARVVSTVKSKFSLKEARKSYDYLVKTHKKYGWTTPPADQG